MSDNGNPSLIFKVELVDKKIIITNNSKHIPTLSYISKELDYDIIELQAIERMKKEIEKKKLIQVALPDFLTRLRGKK